MVYLSVFIIALILAGVVAAQLRTKPKRKQLNTAYRPTSRLKIDPGDGQPLPTEAPVSYRLQKALFSPAEKVFYDSLKQATGQDFIVFGKVRVADILTPESGLKRADWQRAFNKI
ncbi:MAG: DUF2726 domain-containing protein, partial [Cyanobacteria bacterium P01_D01_bin.44]